MKITSESWANPAFALCVIISGLAPLPLHRPVLYFYSRHRQRDVLRSESESWRDHFLSARQS